MKNVREPYRQVSCFVCSWFMIAVSFLLSNILADEIVTTKSGKKVLLRDNGTWEYVKEMKMEKRKSTQATGSQGASANRNLNKDIAAIVNDLQIKSVYDFRKVTWNMSLSQVKKIETLKLLAQDRQTLTYDYILIGMKCQVKYHFRNNKLIKAQYKLQRKHFDPASFNEDFLGLKKYLKQMYGFPTLDQDSWSNDQYKSDKSKWGFAVSIGFLLRTVTWQRERAKTVLQMSGENHKVFITIKYMSKNI